MKRSVLIVIFRFLSVLLLLIISSCAENSSFFEQDKVLHASDFMLPSRYGSQTMFRIVQITVDTNGVCDTTINGTLIYKMADTAYQFSPNLQATLILAGGTDKYGNTYSYDSIFAFKKNGEIRLSTYYADSIGRCLLADPIKSGASFKRTNDSLPSSNVKIESVNYSLNTELRRFYTVKTSRRFTSEIDSIRRDILFENYLAVGHFLVKQESVDVTTNLRTQKSDSSIVIYELFFKNF